MSVVVKYDSNNSGGSFWLKDKDWIALEDNGWVVHWTDKNVTPTNAYNFEKMQDPSNFASRDEHGEWLGASACSACKTFESTEEGIREWENLTHQDAAALGCSCCGPPHSFEVYSENGKRLKTVYPDYPLTGELNYD